jgi:hypothetical protein
MSKKKSEKKEQATPPSADSAEPTPEEVAEKNDMVTFVANNILNSITLNQAVTVVQQIALRDANTIVTEADDDKLKEISTAMETAAAQPPQPEEEAPALDPAPA